MGLRRIIKENWITRKLPKQGWGSTLSIVTLLLAGTSLYLNDVYHAQEWMSVEKLSVFKDHQYWRLWTALFAHADLAHIFGNLFLLIPFAYFLSHYFSLWLFPLIGFALGGLINLLVVATMPAGVHLLGVSGVVYWMGATWMTLVFFIDRDDPLSQRFLRITGVSIILFFPTTILPEVSYLSHFLGYVLGIFTGMMVYTLFRKKFLAAEVVELIDDEVAYFDWENYSEDKINFVEAGSEHEALFKDWITREHVARGVQGNQNKAPVVVYIQKKPIGFIQISERTPGVFTINPFIADRNLIGRGIGSSVIRKFSDELLMHPDIESVVSDPSTNNGAAIRAYKKAGFTRIGMMMVKSKSHHEEIFH